MSLRYPGVEERCADGTQTVNEYWAVEQRRPTMTKISDNEWWHGDYKITPATNGDAEHFAWQFCHVDYDGAPDAYDNRCGLAQTPDECRDEIDIIEGEA